MKKILILLILIFLVGCKNEQTFPAPTNLRIENEVLLWDDEGADRYYLQLNEVTHTLEGNSFALTDLEPGEYTCQVMAAKTGYLNSAYSEAFPFIWTDEAVPENLRIEENSLLWDACANATGYLVRADDEEYQVTENSFDLSTLTSNRTYQLVVCALYPYQESLFTEEIVYYAFAFYKEYELSFDKNSASDFIYDFSEEDFILESLLDENLEDLAVGTYFIEEKQLTIRGEYLNYGQQIFVGLTSQGKIIFKLLVHDDRNPVQVESELVFDGEDIEIAFTLYEYRIVKVEGNEITSAFYEISGNRVIIDKNYLSRKFAEAGRTTLVLSCQFSTDQKHFLSYIFISKR